MRRTVSTSAPSHRRGGHRLLALRLVVGAAAFLVTAPTAHAQQSLNMGAGLRWHGWAQTDLTFAEFFSGNHTIMARFMPQYPRAYRGPILGVGRNFCVASPCTPKPEGPSFALGQGNYGEGSVKAPTLVLEVGAVKRVYLAPDMAPGAWQHVALRREKTRSGKVLFRLYLNGKQLCADPGLYGDCNLSLASPAQPIGMLRLGRTWASGAANPPAGKQQFYGLIDDVAVFKKALAPGLIATLADKTLHPRLTGFEPDLYAGWTFDAATPTSDPLPPALARPVLFGGGAYKWPFLSQTRDDEFDDDYLPVARESLVMDLPFPMGQAWRIKQGWSSGGSHSGTSSFSLDAVYRDGPEIGQKVYASAAGKVVYVMDKCTFPSLAVPCPKKGKPTNGNVVQIRKAPGVITSYRHLGKGSVVPAVGTTVAGRAYIAKVGDHPKGAHLHFGTTTNSESESAVAVTFPVLYRNYELWNVANASWDLVNFGVPAKGQVVRVP